MGSCVHADMGQSSPHSGTGPAAAQTSSAGQSFLPTGFHVLFFESGLFLGGVGCEFGGVSSRGAVVAAFSAGSCVPADPDQSSPHAGPGSAAAQASSAVQSFLPLGFQVLFLGSGLFLGEGVCEVGGVGSSGAAVAVLPEDVVGAVVGVGGGYAVLW